jgi:hypothetical protein
VILKRGEPGDRLSADFERRQPIGDPLVGLGQDLLDRVAQRGQRRALGFLQAVEVVVDFLSGHDLILNR